MIRKREPRWQSVADRARVAEELIEEAESLTETNTIATPADLRRASLPPPIRVELPDDPAAVPEAPSPVPLSLHAALAADPENTALLIERAVRLTAAGHHAAAQHDLDQALRNEPANADALMAVGVLLSRRGLWTAAVARLRRALEVEPGRASAWYQLGDSLNKADDLPAALAAFERAVELEPHYARALYGLGIVLDRLNRPDEATRMYRRSREAAGR